MPLSDRLIVINACHGGFSLSPAAEEMLAQKRGYPLDPDNYWDINRDDPNLIAVVKQLGPKAASGRFAELKIVSIPADVVWEIEEYDGREWISEKHRTWE